MSGFGSDAAVILEEADVADVMVSIFNAPMMADGGADSGGGQACLAGVERYLAGIVPVAGFGVLVPGEAGDPGDGDDQAVPIGAEAAGDVEGLDPAMFLSAMTVAVDGLGAVGGVLAGTDRLELVMERRLVGLYLDDEEVSGVPGRLKSFFDSAWRRR